MEAFEAYKTYVALKNHFTSKTYDYVKYNGRTKASRATFEQRPDKYFFHRLGKHKDIVKFLVANFVYDDGTTWVGDILNNEQSEKRYRQLVKVSDSLSYIFTNDLDKLHDNFDDNFTVEDGQHPHLLKTYLRHEITIETLIILDSLVGYMKKWNKRIEENIIWPQVYLKCKKYKPFITYDTDKCKKIVLDKFSKRS